MKHVKIEVFRDRMGSVQVRPVDTDLCDRIEDYLDEWNVPFDGIFLLQSDREYQPFLDKHLTDDQREHINDGWDVKTTIDPWELLHMAGWDAHEGVKVPESALVEPE